MKRFREIDPESNKESEERRERPRLTPGDRQMREIAEAEKIKVALEKRKLDLDKIITDLWPVHSDIKEKYQSALSSAFAIDANPLRIFDENDEEMFDEDHKEHFNNYKEKEKETYKILVERYKPTRHELLRNI